MEQTGEQLEVFQLLTETLFSLFSAIGLHRKRLRFLGQHSCGATTIIVGKIADFMKVCPSPCFCSKRARSPLLAESSAAWEMISILRFLDDLDSYSNPNWISKPMKIACPRTSNWRHSMNAMYALCGVFGKTEEKPKLNDIGASMCVYCALCGMYRNPFMSVHCYAAAFIAGVLCAS